VGRKAIELSIVGTQRHAHLREERPSQGILLAEARHMPT